MKGSCVLTTVLLALSAGIVADAAPQARAKKPAPGRLGRALRQADPAAPIIVAPPDKPVKGAAAQDTPVTEAVPVGSGFRGFTRLVQILGDTASTGRHPELADLTVKPSGSQIVLTGPPAQVGIAKQIITDAVKNNLTDRLTETVSLRYLRPADAKAALEPQSGANTTKVFPDLKVFTSNSTTTVTVTDSLFAKNGTAGNINKFLDLGPSQSTTTTTQTDPSGGGGGTPSSVVLSGPSDEVREAEDVLAGMDVAPQQVLLEARVYELSPTASESLGVSFNNGGALGNTTLTESGTYPGKVLKFGTFSRSALSVNATLNALIARGEVHVLSRPSVMVLNEQQAEIFVGDNIYFTGISTLSATNTPTLAVESVQVGVDLLLKPTVHNAPLADRAAPFSVSDLADTNGFVTALRSTAGPTSLSVYLRSLIPTEDQKTFNDYTPASTSPPARIQQILRDMLKKASEDKTGTLWSPTHFDAVALSPEAQRLVSLATPGTPPNTGHDPADSDAEISRLAGQLGIKPVEAATRLRNRRILEEAYPGLIGTTDAPEVTLHARPSVSTFVQFNQVPGGGILPQINTRSADTTVRLRDGQPLLIGGLISRQDVENMQKIPLLGDLPVLGSLFRYHTRTRNRTELAFILIPHVLTQDSLNSPYRTLDSEQPSAFEPASPLFGFGHEKPARSETGSGK